MAARILIVDDHAIIRSALRSLLSTRPGWTVCGEAGDGLDAIGKARSLRPDLILMDVSMPGMDGLAATRILRRELPESIVIIVSQNDPAIVRLQAQEVDASACIAKKDLSRDLLPTVSKFLGAGEPEASVPPAVAAPAAPAPDWLSGGGALGGLIRERDWSKTSLGPIAAWPQSLKTSVSICLASRFPIVLFWGPDYVLLYNDAYSTILGDKHPRALGQRCRDCWAEIWDTIGPMLDGVVRTGVATWSNDLFLGLRRFGYAEECYFSFSYSVVQVEAAAVGGIFTAVIETTESVIGKRRLRTLRDLAAKAVDAKCKEDAFRIAAETLSENLCDIPFSALCGFTSGRVQILSSSGIPPDHPLRAVLSEPDSIFSAKALEILKGEQPLELDLQAIGCELPRGAWDVPAVSALLMPVPSAGPDDSTAVLICGINPMKRLDESYRTFFSLVTRQIVTSVAEARSREEERKRLAALAEIDRAKTAFFSNVSHEFRTPLTLMLGPVEDLLAKTHAELSPAVKTQLELVSRNGTRLLRLVNTLLDFSRLEAGRMQAIYQATDLATFTVELASVFRSATEKAGLRLELDCPQLAEQVYVDRGMWEKIVLNLISNAFKFTFEGEISIFLATVGGAAVLRVRDTGVGIPALEIPHVFDRFHRVENTRSRTHEGSGIGLALVQELVKLHGGSVCVESKQGKGTTFIVSIPFGKEHLPTERIGGFRTLASTELGSAPFVEEALRWIPDTQDHDAAQELFLADELVPVPSPPAPSDSSSARRPHILVADDNADMRQYLVRLLSERYDVKAVADGQTALSSAWERAPELVLSDVMMPNLDGFSLLHALRADPGTRSIPVILLSARAGEEARVEGIDHGADDYLIKPFSARELLARVQTHLEIARLRSRAEVALRRRTEQFETLLNEAPLGVYLVDADYRIRAMNPPAFLAFRGIPDLIGRDFGEVLQIQRPGPYADEIAERFRHTLETGEPFVVPEEFRNRPDRGHPEIYEWQISRIPLPEGGYGVVCYFRDITRQVHAREAIAESEKRLRLAAEAAELGIWHWSLEDNQVTWENDRPYQIFGRTRADGVIGPEEFRTKICHPDDLKEFERAWSHTLETGDRFFVQSRTLRQDGTYVWVELSAQVERRADGSPAGFLGTMRDITARKHAEEAVRQSEERLRLAQKAGHSGTWEFNFADGSLITDEELQDLYGLVPGNPYLDREQLRAMIYPGDLAIVDKLLAEAIETGGAYHIEFRIARIDGAERWIESTARIFYDDAGNPSRMVGISTDITERKHIQSALVDSKERLRLAMNAAGMATWDYDVVEDKLAWSENIEPQLGMAPGSFNGGYAGFMALVHPDDRARVARTIDGALYEGSEYHQEYRMLRTDGAIRWTESRGSVFRDENAKPMRMMGIDLDITHRKGMEERERQITAEYVAATAKFRAVFDQTSVFAGIMALDGTVMDANLSCLQECGYQAEEVLGKPFWKTGWWRRSAEAQTRIRAATEQASRGVPYRETLVYHWADDTERLLDFALHPIRDAEGRILFLHSTGIDITEMKRTEERYRTLAETLDAEVRARTGEIVQQSEQLRDLSRRLLQVQDEERRHIARELHDSAGQLLTVLALNLAQAARQAPRELTQLAKWIDESEALVQQLSQEIRTMSYLLHPPLLEERGLVETIHWYIEGLAERSGLEITLEVRKDFARLAPELELVMFRLVQECLTNIHRHSGSESAVIRVARKGKTVTLEVRDEGRGLSAEKLTEIQSQGSGVGIRGMGERVRQFGGQMHIQSNPKGTRISFEFPIPETKAPKRANTDRKNSSSKKVTTAK